MSEIIGRQIEVGASLEATRGTLGASAQKWFKFLTTTFQEKITKVEDKSQHNSFADADGHRITKSWVEGEITGNVHADGIGYFLASVLGSPASVVVLASVKDHTFDLDADAIHPSLSLFLKDGSVRQNGYKGCLVNTLEISASVEDYVKFNANVIGRSGVVDSKVPTYSASEYDFIGKEITIKMADTLAGLAGATAIPAKDFKIKLDSGTKNEHVLGNINPIEGYATKMSVEGSISKNFIDTTYSALYTAGTAKYLQISIIGDALLDATNHPQIVITLNKAMITNWTKKGVADDLVTEDFDFKGYFNATDSKIVSVVLRNLTTGYATGV